MLIINPETIEVVGTVIHVGNKVIDKDLYAAFSPATINECLIKRMLCRRGALIHATPIGVKAFQLAMLNPHEHVGHA